MHISDTEEFLDHLEDQFDEAAPHAGPHDPAEIARYAERLSGLEGLDFDQVMDRVGDTPFPSGLLFARFFHAATGERWGGVLNRTFKPVTTKSLLYDLVPDAEFQELQGAAPRAWVRTTAMPVTKPGVLDLAIDYRSLN